MAVNPEDTRVAVHDDASTKDRLLECALRLFAAKGYTGTSVREIIEEAGVTRPVLYYYFKNKEDLFCHLVETHFARQYEEIDAILTHYSSCRERLKALIRSAFEGAESSPETVQFLLRYFFAPPDVPMRLDSEQLAQERFVRITALMQEGLDRGEIVGGDAASLALAFSGFMDMHVMAKAHRPEARLTPELGAALVDLFMDGATHAGTDRSALTYAFGFEPESNDAAGNGRLE